MLTIDRQCVGWCECAGSSLGQTQGVQIVCLGISLSFTPASQFPPLQTLAQQRHSLKPGKQVVQQT